MSSTVKHFFAAISIFSFNWLLFQPFGVSTTLQPLIVSAQAVFIAALLKHTVQHWIKIILLTALAAALVYLAISKSRAAWLGMGAGLLVIAWLRGFLNNRKQVLFLFGGIVVTAVAAMVFLKTGSSQGRVLIYKVIAGNVSLHDLVTGIGPGQFRAQYNTWQARYFEHHDMNSREALLADNTFYAFNDYLQLVIERGIAGLVFTGVVFICFVLALREIKRMHSNSNLAAGASAAITTLAVAGLFSYPFQNWWIIAFTLLCAGIILYTIAKGAIIKYAIGVMIFLLASCSGYRAVQLQLREQAKHKALELAQLGYKQESLNQLRQLTHQWPKDGHILYLYARELYMAGKADSALVYLQQSTRYINTLENCRLFARIFDENGDTANAERYYLQAVYMVPNRFESRYDLVRFYVKVYDMPRATYWACSVLKLPVKVASAKAGGIKSYCRQFLEEKNVSCE